MTIAAVERETGLSKDTLRVWERRYAFPRPARDSNGERIYPPEQVDKLRLVRRLLDRGFRPGRLLGLDDAALLALATPTPISDSPLPPGIASADAEQLDQHMLERLRHHDIAALRHALQQAMARQGLERFILDTVAPLNTAVGDAWLSGTLQVFEEHLYTEQMQALLRQAIAALPATEARPRVLLTTLPDELHMLGLLMVEGLFTLEGACCVSLGTQTPLHDICLAAAAQAADVVALSFSTAFPLRPMSALLTQLRAQLPAMVELWIGGAGSERLEEVPGVRRFPRLEEAMQALRAWRPPNVA